MDFREVTLEDRERILDYCYRFGENSCQHSFVNFYTLAKKYNARFCEEDGFLFVSRAALDDDEHRVFLFPLGEGDAHAAVEKLAEEAHAAGKRLCFQTVTEQKRAWLEKEFPGRFLAEEIRDYAEYIYLTRNLSELPKNILEGKRRYARQFRRTYADRMTEEPISAANAGEVLAFAEQWLADARKDRDEQSILLEYDGICRQLAHFSELGLSGFLIRIDGKIEAFIYGTPLSATCYDAIVGKGSKDFPNIYKVLYQDLAKRCEKDFCYMNWEEDVGAPGLRWVKLSYKPAIVMAKYRMIEQSMGRNAE